MNESNKLECENCRNIVAQVEAQLRYAPTQDLVVMLAQVRRENAMEVNTGEHANGRETIWTVAFDEIAARALGNGDAVAIAYAMSGAA